jgi:hypothetical protein
MQIYWPSKTKHTNKQKGARKMVQNSSWMEAQEGCDSTNQ